MVKRCLCAPLVIAALSLVNCAGVNTTSSDAIANAARPANASFDAALQRHVQAIKSRDIAEIEATITRGDRLDLIFPDGRLTSTRAEYVTFHQKWFSDNAWRMEFEPVTRQVGNDVAVALFKTIYTDTAADGKVSTYRNWLSLTFRLENGEWRLVLDQNTPIK